MSNIKWNEYTWYSRLLALILFIIIIPVLTFFIGIRYEQTVEALSSSAVLTSSNPGDVSSSPINTSTSTQQTVATSTGVTEISSGYTITNSDMGKTLVFKKGENFSVALSGGLRWTVKFSVPGIVQQLTIPTPSNVQGIYTASEVGTTQLSAQGAPICDPGQACPMFLAVFNATIQVTN